MKCVHNMSNITIYGRIFDILVAYTHLWRIHNYVEMLSTEGGVKASSRRVNRLCHPQLRKMSLS